MEQIEEDWWANWWAADYSWEGLAKRRIDDGRTLQDYWRHCEDDDLVPEVDANGTVVREWTRFHLPYAFADGTPTPKAQWDDAKKRAFTEALWRLLEDARATGNPARFDGIVAPAVPPMPEHDESRPPAADHCAEKPSHHR